METQDNTNIPQAGTWDTMTVTTDTKDRSPKVEFKINETVEVSFADDFEAPREYKSKNGDGVFYVFDVTTSEGEQVVMTSAWSLLRGLKLQGELAGKNVKITKTIKDGRQCYTVANATPMFQAEAFTG